MENSMWNELDLEKILHNKLTTRFDKSTAESIWSDYIQIRKEAINIAEQIKAKEPTLTDHGPKHLANVMENSYKLIKEKINVFTCGNLYFLCIIIMLHDVGNIEGRENHQIKITDIYNDIRKENSKYYHERTLVLQAAAAHCGESKLGDKDTLKQLSESSNLLDDKLRLRELAAILRFADELAEGPQRTCDYIIRRGSLSSKSAIYHVYAQITRVYIDIDRIALTYNIDIENSEIKKVGLKKILSFIYKRIIKLDEERRYCKYYTEILTQYKQTHVTFNITKKGFPIIDIPEIRLEDKFNVSSNSNKAMKVFINQYPQLKIENVVESIQKAKI